MTMKMHLLLAFVLAIAASARSSSSELSSTGSGAGHLSTEAEAFVNGISGFYEMDHNLYANEHHNKWHSVQITWKQAKGAFKWQNRAGVTWTLTPLMGSLGGWDKTKLAVGNDCPYRNEGHEFAMIEWVRFCIIFHFQCNWSLHNLNFLL